LVVNRLFQLLRSKNKDRYEQVVELLKQADVRVVRRLFLEAASRKTTPTLRVRILQAILASGAAIDPITYMDAQLLLIEKNAAIRRAAVELVTRPSSKVSGE
jgi:nicotinate-nucleotide pyrophosphorylase